MAAARSNRAASNASENVPAISISAPQLRPDQARIATHPAKRKVVCMGRRWGKALATDTPIPTPDGWTTMGALSVGDTVFDEQGKPCRVTYVTPVYFGDRCYRVVFSDGSSVVTDGDHLWETWDRAARKNAARGYSAWGPEVRTTEDIRDTLKTDRGETNHSVPVAGPLECPGQPLPIDPYVLGAWLGDGSSHHAEIATDDPEIVQYIADAGYLVTKKAAPFMWNIGGMGCAGLVRDGATGRYVAVDCLRTQLRSTGLLANKHIPPIYQRASVVQREALLFGLMDTDGTVETSGRCRLDLMNERLANDALELVTGLGYKPTLTTKRARLNGNDVGTVYRVSFTAHRPVFRLTRKRERQPIRRSWFAHQRYIVDVRPVPSVPVRCIRVDSPSMLYLATRAMIPTHNTVLGLVLVLAALMAGMRVAWLVPTYRNSNPLWRAVEAALAPMRKAGRAKLNKAERYAELWNGGFLAIYTAESIDAMRGEWFHLVVVDEAAKVPEAAIEEVVEPTLADVDGELVAISTPRGKNWFYRLWRRGVEDGEYVHSWTAPTDANPSPMIRKAFARARDKFGEDSVTFKQEWLALFVDDGARVWLREWCEARYDVADEDTERRVIARALSYDTAAKDKDTNAYSALTVGELMPDYRMRLRHVWRDRLLFPNLAAQVEHDIQRWNFDGKLRDIIIEDQSTGTPLYATLMDSGSNAVRRMLRAFRPTGSKDQRFEQAGVWIKNGSFYLPKPSPATSWLLAFEDEVFEETEFLDQRDSVSQLILYYEHILSEGWRARNPDQADMMAA